MYSNKVKKEHAFKAFSKDIREGDFPPVIFMFGEEGYLIKWAVDALVSRYVNKGCMALDYVRFQEEGETGGDITDACNTFSMISEKRIVWAEEFPMLKSVNPKGYSSLDADVLLEYIKEPNHGTILIFSALQPEAKCPLVKGLKENAKCYDFQQLDQTTLAGFIKKRFHVAGIEPDRDVINAIVDQSGYYNKETEYRIFNLVNDIEKIIAYSSGRQVSVDDVSAVLNGDMDTFIFNLLDAVSGNQKDKAFTLLYNILNSGRDAFAIIAMMVNQFELMLEVAEFKADGMNLPQITSIMKSSEFRIRKAMNYINKFSIEKLRSILSQLYEIDRNIKTGLMDQNLALEILIGRI